MIGPLLKTISCINIGDDKNQDLRLLRSLIIGCWNDYQSFFSIFFIYPLFIFFGLLIPVYMAFRIFPAQSRGLLHKEKFLKIFHRFVVPYRKKTAFYKIFLIFNKKIILFFKEFFLRETIFERFTVTLMIFFNLFDSLLFFIGHPIPL